MPTEITGQNGAVDQPDHEDRRHRLRRGAGLQSQAHQSAAARESPEGLQEGQAKSKRLACEKQARKKYRAKAKSKKPAKKST